MDIMEKVFSELKSLRKQLDGVVEFKALPQAMPYKRAAHELGLGLTELKQMVKLGLIRTVAYGDGKRPKIPLSEVLRLTSLPDLPTEKSRGKPSRKKEKPPAVSSREATRTALRKL